jgi:CDP-2,3-bis-(O-geranylgeranyl)-sn-glycerol synthase
MFKILLLLLVANGAPVLAKQLLGTRWSMPLDAGKTFFDSRPILGTSKTLRGLLIGIIATAIIAPFLGFTWQTGVLLGALSLLGDAFSSFIKRRINIPPSGKALGLDQIPEAILPLWLLRENLVINEWSVIVIAGLFTISELLLSKLLFSLGIRDKPY